MEGGLLYFMNVHREMEKKKRQPKEPESHVRAEFSESLKLNTMTKTHTLVLAVSCDVMVNVQ